MYSPHSVEALVGFMSTSAVIRHIMMSDFRVCWN